MWFVLLNLFVYWRELLLIELSSVILAGLMGTLNRNRTSVVYDTTFGLIYPTPNVALLLLKLSCLLPDFSKQFHIYRRIPSYDSSTPQIFNSRPYRIFQGIWGLVYRLCFVQQFTEMPSLAGFTFKTIIRSATHLKPSTLRNPWRPKHLIKKSVAGTIFHTSKQCLSHCLMTVTVIQ